MLRIAELHDTITAAGITCTSVYVGGTDAVSLDGTPVGLEGVPAAQKQQAVTITEGFDLRPHRPRPLWQIRADIQALTPAQWSNIWADLSAPVSGGPPRKYLTDYGANVAGIFVFDWSLYVSGPTAAQQQAGQISLVAMYTQDNPNFLVHPPFDSSIFVPGDEPVP
jgi:hypothetical protein